MQPIDMIEYHIGSIADMERARAVLNYAGIIDKKMRENKVSMPKDWESLKQEQVEWAIKTIFQHDD